MTDFNQFHDSLNPPPPPAKKMPDMLNVLTILTFIGCAFGLIGAVYNYFMVCKSIEMMSNMPADNPMAGMMGNALESVQRQCEMKLPIFIVNVVCLILCLVGAIQMRKLKKSGFFVYAIGEIVAPIAMIVLAGMNTGGALGMIGTAIGFVFVALFVILYATQLKHMK